MNEELYRAIEEILNSLVRPYMAAHGGDLEIVDLDEDGTLWVRMLGECAGCPSSDDTIKNLVCKVLTTRIPQVKQVDIDSGITDEILEEAMSLMTKRNQKRC